MKDESYDMLLESFLEGQLDEEGQRLFAEYLKTDPEARTEALDLWRQAAGLRALMKQRPNFVEKVMARINDSVASTPQVSNAVLGRIHRKRILWRTTRLCLAAAALIVAVLGLWRIAHSPRGTAGNIGQVAAMVESADAGVFVERPGATRRTLKTGDAVHIGDRIEVAKGDTVTFLYAAEDTRVIAGSVKRMTELTVRDASTGKRLHLASGGLQATAARQPVGTLFVMTTPHARVEIVGTVCSLFAAKERTRIIVDRGEVTVLRADGSGKTSLASDQYCDVWAVDSDGQGSGIYALPLEDLSWMPGRVLWSDDLESGSTDKWEVYAVTLDRVKKDYVARAIKTGKFMQLKRMSLANRDSRVMIVNPGNASEKCDFFAIRYPLPGKAATTRSYCLSYDAYYAHAQDESGKWINMERSFRAKGQQVESRRYSDGRLLKAETLPLASLNKWNARWLFRPEDKPVILDNMTIRELVPGNAVPDPD